MLPVADQPLEEGWNLSFCHRLATPSLTGCIRTDPEDFQVSEILGYELTGEGEHVYIDVQKRDANTAWVGWQLAEVLGVREIDVGYAGRKDRHAVTRQWFSVYLPGQPLPDMADVEIEGVTLMGLTRHRQKLRPGDLAGNRFSLTVRFEHLSGQDQEDLTARLQALKADGFPNYFGEQRFGRQGANLALAEKLLNRRGRFKGNRAMAISAARGWLFNQYLSNELTAGHDIAGRSGELIGKSRDPQPGEAELDEAMQNWAAGLRRLGARVEQRALVSMPGELEWQFTETDMQLSFSLPAGSYATSLLRELIIVKDGAQ